MKSANQEIINYFKENSDEYDFLNEIINHEKINELSIEEILELYFIKDIKNSSSNKTENISIDILIDLITYFISKGLFEILRKILMGLSKLSEKKGHTLNNNIQLIDNLLLKLNVFSKDSTRFLLENEIKISNLKIKNFRLIEKLNINLSKNITILLGKNGFGKTTILQALALSFVPDEIKELKPIDFEPYIKIGKNKSNFILSWEQDIDFKIKTELTINRKISDEFRYFQIFFLIYGTNTFTKYEKTDYSQVNKNLISGNGNIIEIASIFNDFTDTFFDPLRILNDLDYSERNNVENKQSEIKEVKESIIEKLNFLIPEFNIEKEEEGGLSYYFYPIKSEKRNKLTTVQLSEGYKSNIVLLTDILVRIMAGRNILKNILLKEIKISEVFENAYGILAIDEFDRHLHPTWQQNYINNLRAVFPKMQFVLTTHNPMSILDREEDEVIELDYNENLKKLTLNTYKGGTKNMDIVLVLLKYFNIDSVVSQSFKEKIDEYYRLLINDEKNDKFNSLQKELRESHVGVTIPDYEYLKFREFIVKNNIDLRKSDLTESQEQELSDEFI